MKIDGWKTTFSFLDGFLAGANCYFQVKNGLFIQVGLRLLHSHDLQPQQSHSPDLQWSTIAQDSRTYIYILYIHNSYIIYMHIIYMYIYIDIYTYQDASPVTMDCLKSAWFKIIQNLLGHKIPLRLSRSCCNPPKAWDLCNMMVLTQRFVWFCLFSARKTQAEDEKQVNLWPHQIPATCAKVPENDEVRVITNHKLVRPGSALPPPLTDPDCFSLTHPQGLFERFAKVLPQTFLWSLVS